MHYGRLQIFKPDEPVENFFIEKENIAIGRSTGNDLVFERNGVSRYHVSLLIQNQHLVLQDLDSVNGTYVDGIRVRANEQYLLRGGEEIQIGDVRLVFHPVTDADQPLPSDVQVAEFDNFRVELEGPNIPITPGAHAPATINIENTGFNTEHFIIEIDGIPKEWVRLDRGDFDLLPGAQVQVGINFKPLRRPESTPGEYTITVRAYSQTNPEDVAILKTAIHILQYNGYGMVMGTPLIVDDQPFQIYIHNQGNGPLSLNFRGFHKSKSLKFEINTPIITLQPGQRETIVGHIRPLRRIWFGKPRTYSYDVISHSQDAAGFQAPVSGEYMISPVFAQWVLFVGIAAILVGLVALFYSIGTALQPDPVPPQPRITQFDLSASSVEFGDPISFDWQAVRASTARYTVERDDEVILSNELPDIEGEAQPILNLPGAGDYTITIIAINDDEEQVSSSKSLQVNPKIGEFTATADRTIYRNVEGQSVSVVWNVTGIDESTLAQNEAPINLSANDDYSFGDYADTSFDTNIVIPPTTADLIELTLQVVGLNENSSTATQTLPIVFPTCSVSAITGVYQGPLTYFDAYERFGFLPAETSFRVDSRYYPVDNVADGISHWVLIEIPTDLGFPASDGWVDTTQITCPSDFDYTRLVNLTIDQLPVTPRYFNPLELGILRLNPTTDVPIVERAPVTGPNRHTAAIVNGISSSSAREETIQTDTTLTPGRSAIVLVAPQTTFEVDLAENDVPPNMRTLLLPFGTAVDTSGLSRTDILARPAVQTEEFVPTGVFIITGRYGNPEGGSEIRLEESPNIRFKSQGQCMAGEYLTPEVVAFTCYGESTVCEIQTQQTLSVPGRYSLVDVSTGAILASSESIPYNIALRHYHDIFELFDEQQALALAACIQPIVDRDADGVADTEDECPDVAFGGGADCIVYPDGDEDAGDN